MSGLFMMVFLDSKKYDRPTIDRGVLGSYFTELHCELVKVVAP